MKHYFRCKNCGGKITHNLVHPSSIVKCSHCEKEYIIVKNVMAMILELILLFVVALGVRALLSFANTTWNIILELAVVIVMLLILNILFDMFFVKVMKWSAYFHLMEREEPLQHKKRKPRRVEHRE